MIRTIVFLAVAAASQSQTEPPRPSVVPANSKAKTSTQVRLGQTITIATEGLADWLKQHPADQPKLRLYLDGRELIGLEPMRVSAAEGVLEFPLDMRYGADPASQMPPQGKAAWVNALVKASRDQKLPLSIGLEGTKDPFPSTAPPLALEVYSTSFWLIMSLGLLTAIAVFYLSKRSDLLRESLAEPLPEGKRSCFSLARFQMACWFVLVIGAYLYIYLLTGMPPVITTTVLALIGISAATGLSAAIVDSSKRSEDLGRRRALLAESIALADRLQELRTHLGLVPASPAALPAPAPANQAELLAELQEKEARLAKVNADIKMLPRPSPPPIASGNFFLDLLRDNGSVSFHRFQIFVWTIVLGILFIRTVARDLVMPDFDATLLGLMGISSGTYVGFKFPERPAPAPTP